MPGMNLPPTWTSSHPALIMPSAASSWDSMVPSGVAITRISMVASAYAPSTLENVNV